MSTQLKRSAKVYLSILVLLTSHLGAMAQKPPTGGPNPSEPTNLAPVIYAAGGIVLGAATYFYVKNRGPKIAVKEHLPTYLLNRNILPTPDAVNLMVELNPRLNNREVIRANRKLVNPDFPEIPKNLLNVSEVQTTTSMPVGLKEQVDGFTANLLTFRDTEITIKPGDKGVNIDSVHSILNEIEKNITSPERHKEESNTVKNQLMTDLLQVLNQTLEKTIATKILGESETVLIKEISENLSELWSPDMFNELMIKELNPEESNQLHFRNPSGDEHLLFASIDPDAVFYARSNDKANVQNDALSAEDGPDNTNMLQAFAFAVYKKDAAGAVITKGPEVEGKYLVKYVSPALKNFPDAYHHLSPLATYASAYLPPAKLYIIVEDINGKQVDLAHSLIDFKEAFNNPQREQLKEMIIVPLHVTHD